MKTRVVSFRLGLELVAEIDRIAAFYGRNRNQLVNDLLETAVRNEATTDNVVLTKGIGRDPGVP
ncbi:MAG: hypothetical protein DI531_09720 [Brevundimonas sp.]|jgi:metal-responsive CopG/Arc/MetJ family transcriptional regulator|nr:hypothetical protein [Brevundimonas huaxiensis]PZU73814.1 MAG: hypothetical protein DI531_09720 [Brevundimonas sp.]